MPKFQADELDLVGSHVAWLPSAVRAQQIERALHRGLATFKAAPPHQLDGYTEWFQPEAHRTALGMIRQMPIGSRASMAPAVVPFLCEFADVLDFESDAAEDGAAPAAQDVLWRIEDVLLRVAAITPVVVEGSASQQVLRIVAFRRRVTGAAEGLRWAVLDVDRYRWRAGNELGAKTGSFVQLIEYPRGYFSEQLHDVLAQLPAWLWPEKRRKRSYVNQVLARAEVGSAYQPARKLWVRASKSAPASADDAS